MVRERVWTVFCSMVVAGLLMTTAVRAQAPEFGINYDVPWYVAYVAPELQVPGVNYAQPGDPTMFIDDLGGAWQTITMSDFGATWTASVCRPMIWKPHTDTPDPCDPRDLLSDAWCHTDSSRSIYYPTHGTYSDGEPDFFALHPNYDANEPPTGRPVNPGGATLTAVAGYGGGAYPALTFIAPEIGTYSFDGTVLLSGKKWRMYMRKYEVDGTATTLEPGLFSVDSETVYVNEPIDLGTHSAFTGIDLQAGDRIALHVYTPLAIDNPLAPPPDVILNFDAYESDPVKVVKGFLPFSPQGDMNHDYRVDLLDFAVIVQNWLVDCVATQNQDPACQ